MRPKRGGAGSSPARVTDGAVGRLIWAWVAGVGEEAGRHPLWSRKFQHELLLMEIERMGLWQELAGWRWWEGG